MRRTIRWVCVGLTLVMGAACATGGAASKGHEAATRGDWDTAVAYYRQALQENPDRLQAKIGLERATREASLAHLTRARKLEAEDQLAGAIAEYRLATEFDPSNSLAMSKVLLLERRMRDEVEANRPRSRMDEMRQQAAQSSPIPKLDPRTPLPGVKFNNSSIRDILASIGTSTGINVTYDQGLDAQLTRPYTIDVQQVPLEAVLNQVLSAHQLLFKVIDSRTIFIYQDNPQKRAQYEDLYQQIFYVSHADVQEVTQILNQMLTTTTAGGSRPVITQHKTLNAINVRATAPMMALIKNIIDTADKPRAEVLIDVSILEVSRTRLKELGLDLSTYAIGLTFSSNSVPTNIPLQSPPFALGTGARQSDFYATVPSAVIKFLEQDTKTRLLAKPQLRGREGAQLTLNLGDDIPIPQTTFQAAATGGVATIPQTSWTYRSVGVNLQMTPRVTYQDEIILDPLVVDKSGLGPYVDIAGQSLPSFVKRTASVAMRLRDGESNLLAGLIKEEDREVAKSIPGILNIPILRSIFGNTETTTDQSDIVMIVTPHIIRSREITADDLRPLYVGTSTNLGAGTTPTLISPNAPPPPVITPTGQPGQPPPAGAAAATPPAGATTPPATAAAPPTPPATRAPGVVPIQPVGGAPAPPATGAQILVTTPAPEFQLNGPPYTVPVSITGVSQLGSVTLTITYDPKVLRATSVLPGTSFMQQGGVTPTFLPKIDEAAGRIDIAITRTGSAPGASGTGMLAGLVFQAVGAGTARITVTGVAMTPTGQPIPLQLTPASVVVK